MFFKHHLPMTSMQRYIKWLYGCTVFFTFTTCASSDEYTCKDLKNDQSSAYLYFHGFVNGVARGLSGTTLAPIDRSLVDGFSSAQLSALVSGWLDSHPQRLHQPAEKCVMDALGDTFGK